MLRFSIRDVLWLTVVVGLGVGWYQSHRYYTRPLGLVQALSFWGTYENAFGEHDVRAEQHGDRGFRVIITSGKGRSADGRLLEKAEEPTIYTLNRFGDVEHFEPGVYSHTP